MAKYVSPTIDQLIAKLVYLSPEEREMVRRAYTLADEQHKGVMRSSGEPYITHPLAVCDVLADLHADAETICAGFLHDVIEDCNYPPEEIEAKFGRRARMLVLGVTKLSKQTRELEHGDDDGQNGDAPSGRPGARRSGSADGPAWQEEWAENMRQLFLSSIEHPDILVIKLADRLHNMRTLDGHSNPAKRQRIAQETLDIFAPVANRLGMWQFKWELEDLSFRHLYPDLYQHMKHKFAQQRTMRERFIAQVMQEIKALLEKANIQGEVDGRPKHMYSIWRKMQMKGIPFEEVYDVHGFRIIVGTVEECYSMLGLIHTHWVPIPGEFDDYIARPKENGYQSLHTAVIGPNRMHMEVQIRTRDMHDFAEQGVAAHWRYKERGQKLDKEFANKVAWLRALATFEEDSTNATELVESVQADLFSDRVYIFTPKGDILNLPVGSTPIDFAYHIHTEIGHRCRGARVNGKMVRLDFQLRNRDRVEIITTKKGGPSRDWMNPNLGYVRTTRARSKIRQWFRKLDRDQNVLGGRQSLDRLLKQLGLRDVSYEEAAKAFEFDSLDDFLAAIGYGDIPSDKIASKLLNLKRQADEAAAAETAPAAPLPTPEAPPGQVAVRGVDGLETRIAQCCNPLPGDPIVGYVTRGRGVTIHKADCPNQLSRNEPERLIQVDWGAVYQTYPVPVVIQAFDRAALLRDIASVVAAEGINAGGSTTTVDKKTRIAEIHIILNVSSAGQLSRVLAKLSRITNVFSVERASS